MANKTMTEIWCLVIEKDNTQCVTIFGTEEVLKGAQDDWISWCSSTGLLPEVKASDGELARTIDGITNTADRAPNRVAYRFADVSGMALTLMTR